MTNKLSGIAKGKVFSDTLNNPEAQRIVESNRVKAMPTLILVKTDDGGDMLHILTHGTDLGLLRNMLRTAIDQVDAALGIPP